MEDRETGPEEIASRFRWAAERVRDGKLGHVDEDDLEAAADVIESLDVWAQTFLADYTAFISAFEKDSPHSADGEWLAEQLKDILDG